MAEFAAVARAVGHPHRLELVEHLAQGERSVETLAHLCGLSVANASQHLQQLRRAGLVIARRDGRFIRYRLSGDKVVALLTALRETAESTLAEVGRIIDGYFSDLDGMQPVTREELLARTRHGTVTVLDVRPADEYAMGHVPGAVNIPLAELEQRLAELDPAEEIIAYCRGAYCVLSFQAVAALRARKFRARRLEHGFPEWRTAGLPVETAPGP